jgi:hypothetical protein
VFLAVVPTPGLVSVVAFESSGAARPFPGAGVPRGTRRVGLVIVLTLLLVVPYSVSHPFVVNGGGSVSGTRVGDVVVVGW